MCALDNHRALLDTFGHQPKMHQLTARFDHVMRPGSINSCKKQYDNWQRGSMQIVIYNYNIADRFRESASAWLSELRFCLLRCVEVHL